MESEELVKVFGQINELQKQLLRGHLRPSQVRAPLQDILEHKFDRRLNPHWYVPPEKQLANVRRWNEERGWGFADSDFPTDIPDFTPSSPLEVLVLAIYLPGKEDSPYHVRTASELWEIARSRQPNWWQRGDRLISTDHLRLLPGVPHDPGIRWVALDLGAHWNAAKPSPRPRDVRGINSASAEVLAAAAHFPQWVQAMDGQKVPYVWLSGYLVSESRSEWMSVPILFWHGDSREISLGTDWGDRSDWNYSVPVCRDL